MGKLAALGHKVVDYLKAVVGTIITGEGMEKLKHPPNLPYWDGRKYKEIIGAIGAHTAQTIIMTSQEYNNAREALRVANVAMNTAYADMACSSY